MFPVESTACCFPSMSLTLQRPLSSGLYHTEAFGTVLPLGARVFPADFVPSAFREVGLAAACPRWYLRALFQGAPPGDLEIRKDFPDRSDLPTLSPETGKRKSPRSYLIKDHLLPSRLTSGMAPRECVVFTRQMASLSQERGHRRESDLNEGSAVGESGGERACGGRAGAS